MGELELLLDVYVLSADLVNEVGDLWVDGIVRIVLIFFQCLDKFLLELVVQDICSLADYHRNPISKLMEHLLLNPFLYVFFDSCFLALDHVQVCLLLVRV